jgi:hypothetical protein
MDWECLSCRRRFGQHLSQCSYCFAVGHVLAVPHRVVSSIDDLPEVASADELAKSHWDEVRASAYPSLRLGRNAFIVVSGPEASGKSTMVARMLDSINGPVAFVSGEMGLGPALSALLGRLAIRRPDYHCVGRAGVAWTHQYLVRHRVVALGLDSAQALGVEPADVRHLLATTPLRLAVVVSQLNKAGEPAGRRDLVHEADVHIELAEGYWRLAKSRYQAVDGVGGAVLEEEVPDVA